MNKKLSVLIFCFLMDVSFSQNLTIDWQLSFGGTLIDKFESVCETMDGGFICAGSSRSNDIDISGNHGQYDVLVLKLSSSGNIEWSKCLGGTDPDVARRIKQTADGGYILLGQTVSNDGDVNGNHWINIYPNPSMEKTTDIWVVKLNSIGNVEWQKCFGGTGDELAWDLEVNIDGNYIVSGSASSSDGDIVSSNYSDVWVFEVNQNGLILWQYIFDGIYTDGAFTTIQTSDQGYLIGGIVSTETPSPGGIPGHHGLTDAVLIKLDSNGNFVWQKFYGGTSSDNFTSIIETNDGGFLCLGNTESNNFDVSGNNGMGDHWLVKVDYNGNIAWQKCIGDAGLNSNKAKALSSCSDGSYVFCGSMGSIDDGWIAKINEQGDIQWSNYFGGIYADNISEIKQTFDGGYICSGSTSYSDNSFAADGWVFKINNINSIQYENIIQNKILPNPTNENVTFVSDGSYSGQTYEVYDVTGKLVVSGQISSVQETITLLNQPPGVYMLKIKDDTFKIVKN